MSASRPASPVPWPLDPTDQNGWTAADITRIYGLDDPPTVAVVRVPSDKERPPLIEHCLSEQGFVGNVVDGWSVPSDQMEALNLAMYICDSRYPLSPAEPPLTESQRVKLFKYWAGVQTACLRQLGFTIPDPPSQEVWLTGEQDWAPYLFLESGPEGLSHDAVQVACPDEPDDLYE